MKNWWDDLSDEQIFDLKNKLVPSCMYTPWAMKAMCEAGKENRQKLKDDGRWFGDESTTLLPGCVYRLHPDWQRPEPKKKEGHWEYFNIMARDGALQYWFATLGKFGGRDHWPLNEALGMVGFGGIEYEKLPDQWFTHPMLIQDKIDMRRGYTGGVELPAVPIRVRFWVEE